MLETQLLVIGDSHAAFWTGSPIRLGRQAIAGIRVQRVDEGFSAVAVLRAIPQGYAGWALLTFGDTNYADEIWRKARVVAFDDAVGSVVEECAMRVLEIKKEFPRLAFWGPLAAHEPLAGQSFIGNTVERNLAVLTFTAMLTKRLAKSGVPVLSIADTMIAPNGTTLQAYFEDGCHLAQIAMPHALGMVNAALGLCLPTGRHLVTMSERRIATFASIKRVVIFDREWTEYCLAGEARFISEAVIARDLFAPLQKITVATTLDDESYPSGSYEFRGAVGAAKDVVTLPIGCYAKRIFFCAEMGYVGEHDMVIFENVSPLSGVAEYSRESLFALRDQMVPPQPVSVIAEDIVPNISAKSARSLRK